MFKQLTFDVMLKYKEERTMKTLRKLTTQTLAGLVSLVSLSTLVVAPISAEEVPAKEGRAPEKNAEVKLQGVWNVTKLEGGGNEVPAANIKGAHFLIKGDKISTTGKVEDLRRYRIDPARPKEIDLFGAPRNEFSKGIYEIDGDTLKLCFSQSTKEDRPKNFDTEGTRYLCFTLKLAKP